MSDKKEYVLSKIQKLINIIEQNFKDDENHLIHPDWIEVKELYKFTEDKNSISKDKLLTLNLLWKKHKYIEKYKNENKSLPEIESDFEIKVFNANLKELLKKGQAGNKIIAIKKVRDYMLHEDARPYTIVEAKKYVDTILSELSTDIQEGN
jgi:hypothetical protein